MKELGKAGLDVVGYKFGGKKLCKKCFYNLSLVKKNYTISYGVIYRAVIVLSQFQDCEKCGENLTKASADPVGSRG